MGADPTPDAVRLGAIAFNNAFASSNGSFSCGSCHPDGHTDQLLWRIGGECFLPGCVPDEDEPRTTMPVRGLRDSLPLHWDGTLGDPFGGSNGAVGNAGSAAANCDGSNPHTCFGSSRTRASRVSCATRRRAARTVPPACRVSSRRRSATTWRPSWSA